MHKSFVRKLLSGILAIGMVFSAGVADAASVFAEDKIGEIESSDPTDPSGADMESEDTISSGLTEQSEEAQANEVALADADDANAGESGLSGQTEADEEKIGQYGIRILQTEGGRITLSDHMNYTADAGETVTISVSADAGYAFYADAGDITVMTTEVYTALPLAASDQADTFSFTMPEDDVTIYCNFWDSAVYSEADITELTRGSIGSTITGVEESDALLTGGASNVSGFSFYDNFGVTRENLVSYLETNMDVFLGTPYANIDPVWGASGGAQCTGFVWWGLYYTATKNQSWIPCSDVMLSFPGWTAYMNHFGGEAAFQSAGAVLVFTSKSAMLSSGVLEKGDIIETYGGNCFEPHFGYFWGDTPYEDKYWSSSEFNLGTTYAGGATGNKIGTIEGVGSSPDIYKVFKIDSSSYDASAGVPELIDQIEAAADDENGTFTLTVPGISCSEPIRAIAFCVTAPSGNQKWLDANLQEDGSYITEGDISMLQNLSGTYTVDLYVKDARNRLTNLDTTTFAISPREFEVDVELEGDSYVMTAGPLADAAGFNNIAVETHSQEGNDDDLRWLDAPISALTATCRVPLSGYKHYGTVEFNIYAKDACGNLHLLKTITKEQKGPVLKGAVQAEILSETGEFSVWVEGFENDEMVNNLAAEIIDPAGTSHWLDMPEQEDGSYLLETNVSGLGGYSGTYIVKVYMKERTGDVSVSGSSEASLDASEGKVSVEAVSGSFQVTAGPLVNPSGVRNVAIETHSLAGGLDDSVWLDAEWNDLYAVCSVPKELYAHYGEVEINVYMADAKGKVSLVDSKQETVEAPSFTGEITVKPDDATGTYTVTVPGIDNASLVRNLAVQVTNPVGNSAWYDMQEDLGAYTCESNIALLGCYSGTYTVKVYMCDKKGDVSVIGKAQTFQFSEQELETSLTPSGTGYQVKTGPLQNPDGIRNVAVETHSVAGGLDDSRWLDASLDGASAICEISTLDYKHYGTVEFNIYVAYRNGQVKLIKTETTDITTPQEVGKASFDPNDDDGTFLISISGFQNENSVASVAAQIINPIGGECWLALVRQDDDSYVLDSDIAKCGGCSGTYFVQLYMKDLLGKLTMLDSSFLTFSASERTVTAEESQKGIRIEAKGVIDPAGIRNVAAKIWTESGGEDDVIWLDVPLTGSKAALETALSGLKHYGTCKIELYAALLNGEIVLLGQDSIELKKYEAGELQIDFSNMTTEFTISTDFNHAASICNVAARIKDETGIEKWFAMDPSSDGVYKLHSDTSEFSYKLGTYQVAVYVRDIYGSLEMVCSDNMVFDSAHIRESLGIEYDEDSFNYFALGNSLTLRGTIEGAWWNECGMAASSAEKDFFHQVSAYLENNVGKVNSYACNFSDWEMWHGNRSALLPYIDPYLSEDLDLITIELGENVAYLPNYQADFTNLISYIQEKCPNAQIIVVSDFWYVAGRDEMEKAAAESCGADFADISDIRDVSYYYCGLGTTVYDADGNPHVVEDADVARHPNDAGMKYIADTIISKIALESA